MSLKEAKSGHFTELDGMRGVLAVFVMLMHYGMDRIISLLTHGFIIRGEWGLSVDFFFVLSGFVLCRSFLRRAPPLGQYMVKRFFRLAPLYYVALALVLLFHSYQNAPTLLLNILIAQSIFDVASLNFPSWSIPFEMFLPLLGLTMLGMWRSVSERMAVIVLLLFVLGGTLTVYLLAHEVDIRQLRAFFGLGTGMALFIAFGSRLEALTGSRLLIAALFAMVLFILITTIKWPLVSLAFYPLVCALIVTGAHGRSLFSTRPLQALGRWSYSIYLLHIPVMIATQALLGESAVGHNPALKLLLAVVTIALSAFTYRWIEAPAARLAGK